MAIKKTNNVFFSVLCYDKDGDIMELEKEVRYLINEKEKKRIIDLTEPYKEKTNMLDITCGYDGFDSYKKYGYICRIRQKGNKKTLEVKNYKNSNECIEQAINLDKVIDGVNYLKLIGMKPYLYLKRDREVRKYKDLKVFIDEFDIIGSYVEIEYQDSKDGKNKVDEFINLVGINGEEQDMYGGIIKDKLEKDKEFKKVFDANLESILKNN